MTPSEKQIKQAEDELLSKPGWKRKNGVIVSVNIGDYNFIDLPTPEKKDKHRKKIYKQLIKEFGQPTKLTNVLNKDGSMNNIYHARKTTNGVYKFLYLNNDDQKYKV